jgi:hypothetical protein
MQTSYGRLTLQVALACLYLGFFVLFLACSGLTLILFSPFIVFQLLTENHSSDWLISPAWFSDQDPLLGESEAIPADQLATP